MFFRHHQGLNAHAATLATCLVINIYTRQRIRETLINIIPFKSKHISKTLLDIYCGKMSFRIWQKLCTFINILRSKRQYTLFEFIYCTHFEWLILKFCKHYWDSRFINVGWWYYFMTCLTSGVERTCRFCMFALSFCESVSESFPTYSCYVQKKGNWDLSVNLYLKCGLLF